MKTSPKGLKLITKFEGFSATPYECPAKIPTIGFGFTVYPDGTRVTLDDPAISMNEAYEILAKLVVNYENTVNKVIKVELTQGQFDALVSLCYNIGRKNFSDSTLVKELNAGKPVKEVAEHFMSWVKAGGKTLPGLVTRRAFEKHYFLGTL